MSADRHTPVGADAAPSVDAPIVDAPPTDATGPTLPTTFGVAYVLVCEQCGRLEYQAHEAERVTRMQEFHETFCAGGVTIETVGETLKRDTSP